MVEYGKEAKGEQNNSEQHGATGNKLHQKPLGYAIAAIAGLLGGPFGILVSPAVLLVCNINGEKIIIDKSGKEQKITVWTQWLVTGVILAPMLAIIYGSLSPKQEVSTVNRSGVIDSSQGLRSNRANEMRQGLDAAPELSGPKANAIRSARSYLNTMAFSRDGLIQQLASDTGSGYDLADATYAVDSLNVDWDAEAVRSAKSYLQTMGFSCNGLIEQLSSSAGAKFTLNQATYGARAAGACN